MEKIIKNKLWKNILKGVLTLFIILVTLILIYEISIWYDGKLDKSNSMSKDQVISLLEKGKTYHNYYSNITEKSLIYNSKDKNEYFVKDNIVAEYYNSKLIRWDNYNTKETIMIFGNRAGDVYNMPGLETVNLYSQNGFDYSLIANESLYNGIDYKYLGQKQEAGRTFILVEAWAKKDKSDIVKFYIDKETGLIYKRIDYFKFGIFGLLREKSVSDRNIELDVVTDKDVAKPDLSKYEIIGNS